jgi:predicted amidophosphoribosyltransferase
MALTSCAECGTEVSDQARACPSCGAPSARATLVRSNLIWGGFGLLCVVVFIVIMALVG